MTSAIVTGATGFIGSHLVSELLANNIDVTAFCRKGSVNLNRLPSKVRVVFDFKNLHTADVFYHLAWEGASGQGRLDPLMQINNVNLSLEALQRSTTLGCQKFVLLGTIYERFADNVRYKGSFGGSDFYILCKEYAHTMTSQLAYKLGVDYTYCEICHPYGKYVKQDQMFASVIHNLISELDIEFGDGLEYYDIFSVNDLAVGLRLLGKLNLPKREYLIGSGQAQLLRDYLTEAKRIIGSSSLIEFGKRPSDGLHFDKSWFDISDMCKDTGYNPHVSFDELVKSV